MEKTEISSEEIEVIRNSAPYREFVRAHPDASPEKFIEEHIKDLQGYLFKKKYNRALTPLQHYLSLGTARRQELLAEWGASATTAALNSPLMRRFPERRLRKCGRVNSRFTGNTMNSAFSSAAGSMHRWSGRSTRQ